MIRWKNTAVVLLICTVFWCILHESFAWNHLIIGGFLSLFVIFFYRRFLTLPNCVSYHIPLRYWIAYLFLLLYQIAKATLQTIQVLRKKEVAPVVVFVPSKLTNQWHRTLVANSITLTPGTVSVDITKKHYVVIWISPQGNTEEDYYRQIAEPFERLLRKGDPYA